MSTSSVDRAGLAALALALSALSSVAQRRVPLDGAWQLADGRTIQVPAALETALGTGFDGTARYRRTLPLPSERVPRVRIEFEAVATQATVFCNGREVGRHLGGWTPFRVDVTDALRWDGDDVLEVEVDERVGHGTQGFLPVIQPHFGGIWQPVTLCLDHSARLDATQLLLFGRGNGELLFAVATIDDVTAEVMLSVADGERVLATTSFAVGGGLPTTGLLPVPTPVLWSPAQPKLYTVTVELHHAGAVERVQRRVGFRSLRADGKRVLWNDTPLQVRGILHWGYSPPHLAPPVDPAFWRRQLEDFKSLGFNCLKCCLWVPPRCVYESCDELGLLIWQEYPTWHAQLDQAHKQELLTEYGEFFAHDRNHPSVAFRSITCETGHGADFDVVKALFVACKAAVPETLVVDDSSWLGWQRITDFWDEHPYGNNTWLCRRLEDFRRHQQEKGEKPLLLGECIAGDTWFDRAAWRSRHGDATPWWRPHCHDEQVAAEAWLVDRFGPATLRSLLPLSLDFAFACRKFQIERLRLSLPDAGYVVSVARDFGKARMGLYDDLDRLKWPATAWRFHRDTMLCLDLPSAQRAIDAAHATVPVRISHFGAGPLAGELRLSSDVLGGSSVCVPVTLAPGELSVPIELALTPHPAQLTRVRITGQLVGSHPAENHWDVWQVPAPRPAPTSRTTTPPVLQVDALTPALLDALEQGARVLLHAGERPGSLRTESMWFLKGAVFAPPHPLHARLPRDALLELAAFDFDAGRVMPWELLAEQIDPALAFWETHDIPAVRFHLLAGDCAVGEGRLFVSTLRLGEGTALAQHVLAGIEQHLRHGPPPQRRWTVSTIAALRARLHEQKIPLEVFRFRTDPTDAGRAAAWHEPATDVATAGWRDLRAGSHWENQADDLEHYTGIAWYRIDVDVPADWPAARAVFEGVDDSFELWVNGQPAGAFGDAATKTTIWLEPQVAEIGPLLRRGGRNTLVLRVVDHAGAGGLWKPAFLTTGPTDALAKLLH